MQALTLNVCHFTKATSSDLYCHLVHIGSLSVGKLLTQRDRTMQTKSVPGHKNMTEEFIFSALTFPQMIWMIKEYIQA